MKFFSGLTLIFLLSILLTTCIKAQIKGLPYIPPQEKDKNDSAGSKKDSVIQFIEIKKDTVKKVLAAQVKKVRKTNKKKLKKLTTSKHPIKAKHKIRKKVKAKFKKKSQHKIDKPQNFADLPDKFPQCDMQALQNRLRYPEIARQENIEGKVICKVLVGSDGKIKEITIESSDNEKLNNAAIEAIKPTVFIPAQQNGKNVECHVSIPIKFKLK